MELLLSSLRSAEASVRAADVDPASCDAADYVQRHKDLCELQVRLSAARHYEGLEKQCYREITRLQNMIDADAKKAASADQLPEKKAAWRRGNVAKWEAALRKTASVARMASAAFEAVLNN